jgi:adenylate kinase
MAEVTGRGQLLPDELVLALLRKRLATGQAAGERGVLLDGFPRTRRQAVRARRLLCPATAHAPPPQELLDADVDVQTALNLSLREDVLVEKVPPQPPPPAPSLTRAPVHRPAGVQGVRQGV